MLLNGVTYSPVDKRFAESLGVQIVQQELNLIPTLSVAENLLLGRYPQLWGVINRRRLHEQARAALDRFGLQEIDTDQSAGSLGVGQQQMLEIAAALDRKCELLILDEPTAALREKRSGCLRDWMYCVRGAWALFISAIAWMKSRGLPID